MKFNLLKALLLTVCFFAFCLSLYGQPLSDSSTGAAEQLFQDALLAKKAGDVDSAITLYEKAIKSSSTVLAKDDDGLAQAARENREKQFNLSPENPESFDNLDFVYGICLGDQRGMLPFLIKAFEATNDPQRKADYKARIDKLEREMAEEEALKKRAEEAAAEKEAAEALIREASSKNQKDESAAGSAKKQTAVSEEEAEEAAEKAAEEAAAKAAARKEAEEADKIEKLNAELALNRGKMRRLDVRLQELAESIELQENNLSMVMSNLESAQQELSMNASSANQKNVKSLKLQLKKTKDDLETKKKSLQELQELRSAYHARIIRAKKGLGIIPDED